MRGGGGLTDNSKGRPKSRVQTADPWLPAKASQTMGEE